MNATPHLPSRVQLQTLVITRFLNASPELVWKAWTEPERMKKWWGPTEFTSPFIRIDLRVGGQYLACMRSPDGKDFWSTGTYREIVPLKRIVATDSFADEKGNVVPASYYGMKRPFPRELLVTVSLVKYNGGTRLTLRHSGFPDKENRDQAQEGWNQSFDKLTESLKEETS